MRIRMLRTRNYIPKDERRITVKHRAGQEYTIKREWGDDMVAAGDAFEVEAPARDPLDHDNNGRKGRAKKPVADADGG